MADINNQQGVETRSRSRSKTPLRVMETRQGTKIPNVQTIDEEIEPTLTATPVLRTSTRIKDVVKDKVETSTRVIEETTVTSTTSVVTSTAKKEAKKTDTAKKVSKVVGNNSLFTSNNSGNKSKEMSDNDKNALLETSIEAITRSTSSENLANGNGSTNNIPYLVYKEAGEYWNKFPKTDYTYSELSPHRREIAPGQIIMPNMSRGSLDKHHSRVEYMVSKSPEQASYIRERYQFRSARAAPRPLLQYDSGDELDYSQFEQDRQAQSSKYEYTTTTITTRFKRAVTTIITTFYVYFTSLFTSSSSNRFNKTQNLYYTRSRYEARKSWLSRFVSFFTSIWLAVMRRFYVIISSILAFDTWLLMSRSSALMGERKRRFLLLLLFLLPLLLLGGYLFYQDPDFTATVKNSILAWQQSATDSLVYGYRYSYKYVQEKVLTIIGFINFGQFYDNTVVPFAENTKVVLQDYTKYCIDGYQSVVNYGRDIWNENFKSGPVAAGSGN